MSDVPKPAVGAESLAISEDKIKQAEAYIEAEEGALNRLSGIAGITVTTVAGTSVATPADLFTYKGCVVTKLAGAKLKTAKKRLRKGGCKLGKVKKKGLGARNGKVVVQGKKPGKVLAPGTKIAITLG